MNEYAVTISSAANQSAVDFEAVVDAVLGALPSDAAVAYQLLDREISVTFCVAADDVYSASARGGKMFAKALRAAGVADFRDTEVHTMDWATHERDTSTSNMPDLVSAPEVAAILGVSRQRVHQLLNDNSSFPPPILRLGSGPLWLRMTIEAFERSWARKPGRPRVAS